MIREECKNLLSRRDLLVTIGAASIMLSQDLGLALAYASESDVDRLIAEKLRGITATTNDGKITLDLPDMAENGSSVQFTVSVDSPMSLDSAYVKEVHVFAGGNPIPVVASYYFTPLSGKATVTSRMRLAQKQNVHALAIMSDGLAYLAKKTVDVSVGGCG